MSKLKIRIYTDGACSGNPGPGGWAALILVKKDDPTPFKDKVLIKGGEKHTTNNRMELEAVIESLKFVYKNIKSETEKETNVYSDSSYVVNSINNKSLSKWIKNGWKTTKGTDVINQDLWVELVKLDKILNPSFIKIKGHDGNKFNEYVDQSAVKECNKYKKLLESL